MYNPTKFKALDRNEAFELMDQNPFAALITVANGSPFISQIPMTVKKVGEEMEIIGHVARANPHWKYMTEASGTAIFQGPHTYITSAWYAESNVPTWNYAFVHVTGHLELIEDEAGIIECLQDLTAQSERHWPSGWKFEIPDDLQGGNLSKHIVAFRMKVQELHFKKKMSQNRSAADRAGVMQGLNTREDENSKRVLEVMEKMYTRDGEPR